MVTPKTPLSMTGLFLRGLWHLEEKSSHKRPSGGLIELENYSSRLPFQVFHVTTPTGTKAVESVAQSDGSRQTQERDPRIRSINMYRDPAVCWTVFQEPGTQQKMKMTKSCLHKPFIPAGPRHSSKLLENNECYGKTKQVEKKKRETEMQNGGIRVFYKILRFFFFLTARQHAQIDERKNFQLLIAPNKRRLLCYTGPCVVLPEMGCQ